jgi:threonine dehydrogenase-like Zn-dependent dehydrogenase
MAGVIVLVSVIKDDDHLRDPDFHRKEMTLLGSRKRDQRGFPWVMDVRSAAAMFRSTADHAPHRARPTR